MVGTCTRSSTLLMSSGLAMPAPSSLLLKRGTGFSNTRRMTSRRRSSGTRRRRAGSTACILGSQLPNCVEAALVFYGASLLGAVVVPIVHFCGPKEVRYILGRSGARLLVTAERFRGIEFLDLLEAVVVDTPALERVFVAGEEHGRWAPFSDLADGPPADEPVAVDPAAPALIGW